MLRNQAGGKMHSFVRINGICVSVARTVLMHSCFNYTYTCTARNNFPLTNRNLTGTQLLPVKTVSRRARTVAIFQRVARYRENDTTSQILSNTFLVFESIVANDCIHPRGMTRGIKTGTYKFQGRCVSSKMQKGRHTYEWNVVSARQSHARSAAHPRNAKESRASL